MAGFTFKLVLSGLMAFVPHSDGKQVTILVPEPGHRSLPHHAELKILIGEIEVVEQKDGCEVTLAESDKSSSRSPPTLILPSGYDLSIGNSIGKNPSLDYRRCRMMSPNPLRLWRRICLLEMNEFVPEGSVFDQDFLRTCTKDCKEPSRVLKNPVGNR